MTTKELLEKVRNQQSYRNRNAYNRHRWYGENTPRIGGVSAVPEFFALGKLSAVDLYVCIDGINFNYRIVSRIDHERTVTLCHSNCKSLNDSEKTICTYPSVSGAIDGVIANAVMEKNENTKNKRYVL